MAKKMRMAVPFTQVANSVLNDRRISSKAKGLYAYIYSKPEDWNFSIKRISDDMSDGRESVEAGIKELERFGYIQRTKLPTGRMEYFVVYPPLDSNYNPITGLPNLGKTQLGVSRTISNKEGESPFSGSSPEKERHTKKEVCVNSERRDNLVDWFISTKGIVVNTKSQKANLIAKNSASINTLLDYSSVEVRAAYQELQRQNIDQTFPNWSFGKLVQILQTKKLRV